MTGHTTLRTVLATAVLALVSAGGQAHHSLAIFDQDRQITLPGTVRAFQ